MSRLQELIAELCPDGVEYRALGNLCAKTFNIKWAEHEDKSFRYIDLTSVDRDFHKIVKTVDIDSASAPSRAQQIVATDDILFGATRPTLMRYCQVPPQYDGQIASTGYAVFRFKQDLVLPRFAMHCFGLPSFMEHLETYQKGSAYPAISMRDLKRFRIPVPPIEVQREVVRILDEYTAAHDELVRQLEQERYFRERQLSAMRNYLLDTDEFSDVKWSTLGETMTIERGASPRPIKNYMASADDGVPWIKIGDVDTGGKYITSTAEYVTQAGAAKSRYLQAGSFVLSNSMSYGRPYILKIDGCIHDGWLSLRDYDESFDTDYLYYLLRSEMVQRYWDRKVNSSSVSNLNSDLVKGTPVPVLPIDRQAAIARQLNALDEPFSQLITMIDENLSLQGNQLTLVRNQLLSFPEKEA